MSSNLLSRNEISTANEQINNRKNIKRFLKYLRPFYAQQVFLLLLIVISAGISAFIPLIFMQVIDKGIAKNDFRLTAILVLFLVIAIFIEQATDFIKNYLFTYLGQKIVLTIKQNLFTHLSELSPGFYSERKTGELMAKIESDVGFLENIASHGFLVLVSSIVIMLATLIFIFYLNWFLSALSLLLLPGLYFIQRYLGNKTQQTTTNLRKQVDVIYSFLQEAISGMRNFQIFNVQKQMAENYKQKLNVYAELNIKMSILHYFSASASGLLAGIAMAGIFIFGAREVANGFLTIGGLIAFVTYYFRVFGPINELSNLHMDVRSAQAAINRIFKLLDTPVEIKEDKLAITLEDIRGGLEFKNVTFSYGKKAVLNNFNLTIPPRQTIAIVGSSGIGKTTISSLILRLFDPQNGSVLIDNIDIRTIKLSSIRQLVGIITQEPFLINDTIENNLRLGCRGRITKQTMVSATDVCQISDFIYNLPNGFSTIVGERGVKLSGGQKQRIAIARLILQNPAIAILDEATSSLDLQVEKRILSSLRGFLKERTSIVITHRLSTAKIADKVFFMSGKGISEKQDISVIEHEFEEAGNQKV